MTTVQYSLFGETLDQQFDRWILTPAGQEILSEVVRLALEAHSEGRRRGIKSIAEQIRENAAVRGGGDDERYKLNNVYTSRLARLAMERCADLRAYFEVRRLSSRDVSTHPNKAVVIPIATAGVH